MKPVIVKSQFIFNKKFVTNLSFIFCAFQTTLKMVNKILILKVIVTALQVGLIILLITSGLHFKDVKRAKDYAEIAKKLAENTPEYPGIAKAAQKVYIKCGALLAVIILSTLKVPVIAAGLFLNHIFILFGSFMIDMVVAVLYLVQWGFITESYPVGSWLGILCSIVCGIMTVILIRFIRRDIRYS